MIRVFVLPLCTLLLAVTVEQISGNSEPESEQNIRDISYPEHLTGTFTGGFGEETCRSCHFDYDLNPDDGSLSLSGILENIAPGETVELQITVERDELGAAGFQLSARYEDGRQAGRFDIEENDRLMFSEAVPDSLQYVQHTNKGANPSQENTNSWTIKWTAPEPTEGTILFNIAANAANGDQSEFGDFIYSKERKVNFR